MPYVKHINGHSKSLQAAAYYFEHKGGERALAFDSINVAHHSLLDPEMTWDKTMDKTREERGNNKDVNGQRALTYKHIMISLDERDKQVTLDQFRDYVRTWCERYFDHGKIGNYQVAIIYHHDNASRLEQGKEGILHAHIIVNNTDLDTNRRISPRYKQHMIDDMNKFANDLALSRGFRAFAENGESMTQKEMVEQGLNPSKNRVRETSRAFDREGKLPLETNDIPGMPDPIETNQKVALRFKVNDGRVYDVYANNPRNMPTMAERKFYERNGHSWKQDIRGRVEATLKVSRNRRDFLNCLATLGIQVSYNRRGEIKYSLMGKGNEAKQVLGSTLGKSFTAAAVNAQLGTKNQGRRQRVTNKRAPRHVTERERTTFMGFLKKCMYGTREGTSVVQHINKYLNFVNRWNIKTYGDFPKTEEGAGLRTWASKYKLLDSDDPKRLTKEQLKSMTREERMAYKQKLRDAAGHGGREVGAGRSVSNTYRRNNDPGIGSGTARARVIGR